MAETWATIPLNDVSTSELVTAAQLNALGNNHRFQAEVGYAETTSDTSVSGTTVGTANQVVSLGAISYDAVPTMFEFYAARATSAASIMNIILRDGSTVLGTLAQFASGEASAPIYAAQRFTPTAASHTYNVAAWIQSAGTWTIEAGAGGTAGNATTILPAWIRATRIPT